MSEREMKRGMLLLTLQDAGKISKLRFQPRFDLKVNDIKIAAYVADADYYNDEGEYVIEDVKGSTGWQTDVSKIKMKLFRAIYGKDIRIIT